MWKSTATQATVASRRPYKTIGPSSEKHFIAFEKREQFYDNTSILMKNLYYFHLEKRQTNLNSKEVGSTSQTMGLSSQAFSPKNDHERISRGLYRRWGWMELAQLFWRERFSKVVRAYILSPYGKGRRLLIKQTWIYVTQRCFVPSLIKISPCSDSREKDENVKRKSLQRWQTTDN